jgi:glyoxylase-like metal-dependent hydrolase (beta-lactamase superfamily II)/ferredoxin
MARADRTLPGNVPGDLFVDDTCIDCGTCRVVAGSVFADSGDGHAVVRRQPATPGDLERALVALVACPTASIGSRTHEDAREAAAALPEEVVPGVFYCGYASEDSFGASSWLIAREDGNVLVDSPRAAGPLLRRLEELGGVRLMFLTHRDDVADHARFHARFGCERVLHQDDLTPGTTDVERVLTGTEPIALAPDLLAIPVPGHTPGSTALLHRDVLFSGDHLMAREDGSALLASRSVCWWSWPEQVASLRRLLAYPFRHVLPGHGGRYHAVDVASMHAALAALVARYERRST